MSYFSQLSFEKHKLVVHRLSAIFLSSVISAAAQLTPSAAWGMDPIVAGQGERFMQNLPADWNGTVGAWDYFDVVDCFTKPGAICAGSNPTSPYGFPVFASEDTGLPVKSFQLHQHEAIVIFLRTPPKTRYFALTQYLMKSASSTTTEFASLSDSLNNTQINTTDLDGTPFNQYAAVVWTPDLETKSAIEAMLVAQGVPASSINFIPMPVKIEHHSFAFGYGSNADEFTMLMRTALPELQADLDSYIADNPVYIAKVGPANVMNLSPSPTIGYQSDITGRVESAMSPNAIRALDSLVADIKKKYSSQYTLTANTVTYTEKSGWDCILGDSTCAGDNQDALYSRDTETVRVKSLDDFVIIAGVNHRLTGKATYLNHSVYDLKKIAGIVGVTDLSFTTESAVHHAGISPTSAKARLYKGLYAYMVSYNCAGRAHCLQIPAPTPENPVGLEPGAPFLVVGRSYLEPTSGVAPAPSEVIKHKVFLATKK